MKKKSIRDYLPDASDDFWLIDEAFLKIAEKEKRQGTDALSGPEKAVGLVWHVYGIVGNGGLHYFFEHTFDVEEVAGAYEAVGLRKQAAILRKAITKFPNSRRPRSFRQCLKILDEHDAYFESLSMKFLGDEDAVERVVAAYIKKRPQDFL